MPFSRPFFGAAIVGAALAASLQTSAAVAAEPAVLQALPLCPEQAMQPQPPQPPRTRRAPIQHDEPLDVTSDQGRYEVGGDATVTGQVVVRQSDRRLTADQVHVDPDTERVDASGHVQYDDPELTLRGDAGRYQDGAGQFSNAQFDLVQQPGHGKAATLALDANGIVHLTDVTFTTCPPGNTAWQIRANSVRLDTEGQAGIARDAKVEFQGVPILYLPWISFPLGNERESGFLFPSIGDSSSGGLQLSTPYYLNLAPNYDLTLQPTFYSRRGLDYMADFRFLTTGSRGSLDFNVLPHDQVADQERSRIRVNDVTELPDNWRLRISAENVSDTAYFEDFSQGVDSTSLTFLPRQLELSYRDDHWRSGLMLSNFQTLDTELASTDRPYTELPRIYADGLWAMHSILPLQFGFDSEAVDFRRNAGVQGWRLDLQPHAELLFDGAGYFLHPGIAFRSTTYDLTDTATGEASTPSRNLPIASVDAGLIFERDTDSGSRRITLEPRLMYLYVPYRNQDSLPVFDTGLPDLNTVELFRDNRYVGADRIGDANQVSAGVTTRIFASDSGTRYLSATLGETFYLSQPRVTLPDEVAPGRQSSDLIAQVELKAFEHWSVDAGLQWDHQDSRAQESDVRVQYRPDGDSVVNLGYRFQRGLLEQADFSIAWPVTHEWSLYGRMLYSLSDHDSIDQFAGVQYSSCCWGIRVVARHYLSSRTGQQDTGLYLQLELKGLSNVGTASDAFLERGIRGYSPTAQKQ